MSKRGPLAIGPISLSLESGKMEFLNHLTDKFKDANIIKEIESQGFYTYNKMIMSPLTVSMIAHNKIGLSLGTVMCVHCKKTIIMSMRSIVKEECEWCPSCCKHVYDSSNKKQIRRW